MESLRQDELVPPSLYRPTRGTLAHQRHRDRLNRRALVFLVSLVLLYLITSHDNVALLTSPLFALLVTAQVDQWFLTRSDQRVPLTAMLRLALLAFPVIPVLVALLLHGVIPAEVGMQQMFVAAWTCWGLFFGRAAAQSRLGDQVSTAARDAIAAVLSVAGLAASFGYIADVAAPITTTVDLLDLSCGGVKTATPSAVLEIKAERDAAQQAVLKDGLFTYETPAYFNWATVTLSLPNAAKPISTAIHPTAKDRVTEVVTRIVSLGQLGTKDESPFMAEHNVTCRPGNG